MIDPYLKCLKKYKDKKKKEDEGEISSQTIIDNAIYFFNSDEVPDDAPDEESIKPHHVEYYLDISVDSEIEPIYFCKSVHVRQKQNILSDQDVPFNCADLEEELGGNIYDIDTSDIPDEDRC